MHALVDRTRSSRVRSCPRPRAHEQRLFCADGRAPIIRSISSGGDQRVDLPSSRGHEIRGERFQRIAKVRSLLAFGGARRRLTLGPCEYRGAA